MKKTLLALLVLMGLIFGATFLNGPSPIVVPGTITLEAQSLPKTVTLMWDANAPADNVTNYVVRLDGVVVGSPTGTTQACTITTLGTHTFAVRAVNAWAESPDATLVVNVIAPARPANVRLQ